MALAASLKFYTPLIVKLGPGMYKLSGNVPWYAVGRYFATAAAALKLVAVLKRISMKRGTVELSHTD